MSTSIIFDDLTPEQIETVKAFAHAVKNQSTEDLEWRLDQGCLWTKKPQDEDEIGGTQKRALISITKLYRIKPQPKLIPFDFSDAEKLIGKAVKRKSIEDESWMIMSASSLTVRLFDEGRTDYKFLLNNYTFLDGSPCGKVGK